MRCDTCETDRPASAFNAASFSPHTCFRCRVSGVAFTNPVKTGQGDDAWRHDTIRDYGRRQVAEAAENGLEAVPVSTAGGYTPSKSQLNKLAKA